MPFKGRKWDASERKRLREILLAGNSLEEAGRHFGVTRQRVEQVIKKFSLFNENEIYGYKKGVRERQEKYRQFFFNKNGFYPEEAKDKKTVYWRKLKVKFYNKKQNAMRCGVPWDIEFSDILFPETCPMLGIQLDYDYRGAWNDSSPSFDRIDPNKGYVKGNVQVISFRANRIKNNASLEELESIVNYMKGQKVD